MSFQYNSMKNGLEFVFCLCVLILSNTYRVWTCGETTILRCSMCPLLYKHDFLGNSPSVKLLEFCWKQAYFWFSLKHSNIELLFQSFMRRYDHILIVHCARARFACSNGFPWHRAQKQYWNIGCYNIAREVGLLGVRMFLQIRNL
jgi:hypothetical protein